MKGRNNLDSVVSSGEAEGPGTSLALVPGLRPPTRAPRSTEPLLLRPSRRRASSESGARRCSKCSPAVNSLSSESAAVSEFLGSSSQHGSTSGLKPIRSWATPLSALVRIDDTRRRRGGSSNRRFDYLISSLDVGDAHRRNRARSPRRGMTLESTEGERRGTRNALQITDTILEVEPVNNVRVNGRVLVRGLCRTGQSLVDAPAQRGGMEQDTVLPSAKFLDHGVSNTDLNGRAIRHRPTNDDVLLSVRRTRFGRGELLYMGI